MNTLWIAILSVWILCTTINAAHSTQSQSWQPLSRLSRKNQVVPSVKFFLAKSNNNPEESTFSGSSSDKGVQIMITNKMRRILVNELNYLESEVDDMEPQIAAVLIDRKLSRPKKGVPQSWLKPAAKKRQFNSQISSFLQHFSEKAEAGLNFGRTYIVPLLPVIVAGSIVYLQRDLLLFIGGKTLHQLGEMKTNVIKSISALQNSDLLSVNDEDSEEEQARTREDSPIDRAEEEEGVTRRRIAETIRVPAVVVPSPTLSSPQRNNKHELMKPASSVLKRDVSLLQKDSRDKERVNILDYDRVRRQSLWDDVSMKTAAWKKKMAGK